MQTKIKNIADVIVGYTFRRAIEEEKKGDIFVLQAKNVTLHEYITDTANLLTIFSNTFRSAARLQCNDVIIVSRGMGAGTFKSSVFKSTNQNTIASSSVLVIRLKSKAILPEYLSLYLNAKDGQMAISQIVSGSHFKTLLRRNLQNLEIPVPPIETQKTIMKLCDTMHDQEKLIHKMSVIKENVMNATFRNIGV